MLETMMHVLEALQYAGGAPSGLSLMIHVRSSEQHAAYLDALTSLLGQGVYSRGEGDGAVYSWHEWRHGAHEGRIVLHEPHSAAGEAGAVSGLAAS